MRMRAMRGHLKLGPIATQLPSKKPSRFKSARRGNQRPPLDRELVARLLRVMNPMSYPENHKRLSSPLSDRYAHRR